MNNRMLKKRSAGKIGVVLSHEFRRMAFTKTFIVTTILGPFILAAITILPSIISMKAMDRSGEALSIGLLISDTSGNGEKYLLPAFEQKGWDVTLSADAGALKSAVLAKEIEGYLKVPSDFPSDSNLDQLGWYSKNTTDFSIPSMIEKVVSSVVVSERIRHENVDELLIRSLIEPVSLHAYRVSEVAAEDGKSSDELNILGSFLIAITFCMIIYMTVLLYGQQIGRSVVSEKSSKIVDILLSSISSDELLFGKIFGIGLAGLLQYGVWLSFAFIIIKGIGPAFNMVLPVEIGMDKFGWLVLFFLGGYLLYSSIYAAFGAASEDDQHMAQLSMPVLLFLLIPMILLQLFISNPDSAFTVFCSYFPFTSPMVMLIRILVSDVPVWSVLASLVVLGLSVVAIIKLAAKIFRTGIMMTGKNFSFKDIALWLRA